MSNTVGRNLNETRKVVKERLTGERDALSDKLHKALCFINDSDRLKIEQLTDYEIMLLQEQVSCMGNYYRILCERIKVLDSRITNNGESI